MMDFKDFDFTCDDFENESPSSQEFENEMSYDCDCSSYLYLDEPHMDNFDSVYGQQDNNDLFSHNELTHTSFNDLSVRNHSSNNFNQELEDILHRHSIQTDEIQDKTVSFGSKYSQDEIDKMKSDLKSAENDVSTERSNVESCKRKVNLSNTPLGHKNGTYELDLKRLNEAVSKYNYAVEKFNKARSILIEAM